MSGRSMMQIGNKILAGIYDCIFPKRCLSCKKFDVFICKDCLKKIKKPDHEECPICRKENSGNNVCLNCKLKTDLSYLWVMSEYDDLVKTIICEIKYNFVKELIALFDEIIERHFKELKNVVNNPILIPIPLHKKRYSERGFNQAQLIAERVLSFSGGIIVNDLVIRNKYSAPQAKLKANERRINLVDHFAINTDKSLLLDRGRQIVLIDDVYTTGATMSELAVLLKKEGFYNIGGIVLARGVWS